MDLLTKHAQALVRHLEREEIESIIPEELADFFSVEEYGDDFLVRVRRQRDGIGILQEICDCDCAKMHEIELMELAAIDAALDAEEEDDEPQTT